MYQSKQIVCYLPVGPLRKTRQVEKEDPLGKLRSAWDDWADSPAGTGLAEWPTWFQGVPQMKTLSLFCLRIF